MTLTLAATLAGCGDTPHSEFELDGGSRDADVVADTGADAPTAAPIITMQPVSAVVVLSVSANLSVTATGTALSYQWRKGGTAIGGATASTLTIASVQATDAGRYSVVISNSAGSVTSDDATLTVATAGALGTPPSFSTHPEPQRLEHAGEAATFEVAVIGILTPSLQWQRSDDGTTWSDIPGATSLGYTFSGARVEDSGTWFRCVATNAQGSAESNAAPLSVKTGSESTYYVSTTGDDDNPGTLAEPWATLTHAASDDSLVAAGDTVYIESGLYRRELVVFRTSGTAANPITFRGYRSVPGDAPPILTQRVAGGASAYAPFDATEMPTFDGEDRSAGTAFVAANQEFLVIENFQIRNYDRGFNAGGSLADAPGHLVLDNVNVMTVGDVGGGYGGLGITFGSMSTAFSNDNLIKNCLVVNSTSEGITLNGDYNTLFGSRVYSNEVSGNASLDYYVTLVGSYNTVTGCYIEREHESDHNGHGYSVKSNAWHIIDDPHDGFPVIRPRYNHFYYNIARNMGEGFCVRHREVQYNLFYHCTAYGTNGDAGGGDIEGNGVTVRDGASHNRFDGIVTENVRHSVEFQDTTEDGDHMPDPPPGHPSFDNLIINGVFRNSYYGVNFDEYAIPTDAGDNTIANSTFYVTHALFRAEAPSTDMNYVGNVFAGAPGSEFKVGMYADDIVSNGRDTYFRYCSFSGMDMPDGFVESGIGNTSVDPLLVDAVAGNFALQSDSQCIDSVPPSECLGPDFNGILRPQGDSCDMGAFEYLP